MSRLLPPFFFAGDHYVDAFTRTLSSLHRLRVDHARKDLEALVYSDRLHAAEQV